MICIRTVSNKPVWIGLKASSHFAVFWMVVNCKPFLKFKKAFFAHPIAEWVNFAAFYHLKNVVPC
jgi:hypothetical protein